MPSQDHDYLYHVTHAHRLPGITEHGLQPDQHPSIGNSAYDANRKGRIFLTEKHGVSHWYGKSGDWAEHASDNHLEAGTVPVVLRVHKKILDNPQPDHVANRESIDAHAHAIEHPIEPEYMDVWDGKQWRDLDAGEVDHSQALDPEHDPDSGDTLYWMKQSHDNPLLPKFSDENPVQKLGKSQREKNPTQVASVAATRDGRVLIGKRTDSGKWNFPGGHLNPNERPEKGAVRELLEETGLVALSVEKLGVKKVKDGSIEVHSYRVEVGGKRKPTGALDPDEELEEFRWVDPLNLPDDIQENLHNGAEDVTLKLLGAEKHEAHLKVPVVSQDTNYTCGPAALRAVLKFYGIEVSEERLVEQLQATAEAGTTPRDLERVAREEYGLDVEARENMGLERLRDAINDGRPVIIAIQAWYSQDYQDLKNDDENGHYVVAVGHDRKGIIIEDPSRAHGYGHLSNEHLLERWHDREEGGKPYQQYGLALGRPMKKSSKGWQPAFQHRHTQQTVVTPVFHDTDLLPGGEFTDDWVDGFVDPQGRFFDREATRRQTQAADSFQLQDHQNRDLVGKIAAQHQYPQEDMSKAAKSWRSKDGVSIPVAGSPERQDWDQRYHQQLVQVFAQGRPEMLRPLKIPTDAASGTNMPVNKDRLNLYRRMARAGEPLPPVIVRRNGLGYTLIDGNHRQEAARQAGHTELHAYEIVPLKAPPAPKKKLRKTETELPEVEPPEHMDVEELANHQDPSYRACACQPHRHPERQHLEKLISDPHPGVRQKAKKAVKQRISYGADHERSYWLNHESFTPHDLTEHLRNSNTDPVKFLEHPHYGKLPEHELAALDNFHISGVVASEVKHPESVEKILASNNPSLIDSLALHQNGEHAQRALDWMLGQAKHMPTQERGRFLRVVARNSKASDAQIQAAITEAKASFPDSYASLISTAPRLPVDMHEELALRDPDPDVRRAAVSRSDTSPKVLMAAIRDNDNPSGNYHTRTPAHAAAEHPNLPREGQLYALQQEHLQDRLLRRRDAPLHPDTIRAALDLNDRSVISDALGQNRSEVNEEVAAHAATHSHPEARRLIARRYLHRIPHDLRVKLSQDPEDDVRGSLLVNEEHLTAEDYRAFVQHARHEDVCRSILSNRNARQHFSPEDIAATAFGHEMSEVRYAFAGHLIHDSSAVSPETPGHVQRLLQDPDERIQAMALQHHSVGADQLEPFMSRLSPRVALSIAKNPNATSQQLHRLVAPVQAGAGQGQEDEMTHHGTILRAVVSKPQASAETLDYIIEHGGEYGSREAIELALEHPRVNPETLKTIASDHQHAYNLEAKRALAVHDPDTAFEQSVSFGLGTNKLRKIRDLVTAGGDKPQHKNNFRQFGLDLTPFCRPGTAFVDPEKIQAGIDSKSGLRYNVSHDTWDDAQRHSREHSKVFQLNLSTDIVNKLKQAGVYETFKTMQAASHASGHPIHKDHGLGWIRYTQHGDPTSATEQCDYCTDGYTEPTEEETECSTCDGHGQVRERDCDDCEGNGRLLNVEPDALDRRGNEINFEGCTGTPRDADDPEGQVSHETQDCPVHHPEEEECRNCDGHGQVEDECGDCDGSGQTTYMTDSERCYECKGTGTIERRSRSPNVDPDKDHFFIDEVQSDFGQDFAKTILANTRNDLETRGEARGLQGQALENFVAQHMATAEAEAKKFPPEHCKQIAKILFQGKHSNEILYEAFLQHLRDEGHAGSQVAVHSVDSKGPISLGRWGRMKWINPKTNQRMDLDGSGRPRQLSPEEQEQLKAQGAKEVRDIPGHFLNTYEIIPQKTLGWSEQKYGDLKTQTGHTDGGANDNAWDHLDGARTYGDQLYKHEFWLDQAPSWEELNFSSEAETWLAKATRAEDFKQIAKATTAEGRLHVDHQGQMAAHPPSHGPVVEHYHQEVLQGPKIYSKKSTMRGSGITRKLVYQTPGAQKEGARFMIKPYHEAVVKRIQAWQRYPVQGWAEMTHQALYHAGGIGHLHQKVHVAEHDMGPGHEKEPALVVHMTPGFKPVADAKIANSGLPWGLLSQNHADVIKPTDQAMKDVRKIGIMDMLTNNLDRHGGNLMINGDGSQVLAVDHSRSFQYVNNHQYKWDGRRAVQSVRDLEDKLHPYIAQMTGGAIFRVDPYEKGYDEDHRRLRNYGETIEWWGKHGQKIRSAMYEQLKHLKDPKVRAHIRRNFDERAKWLDERADLGLDNYGSDFHRDPVIQYHPDQKNSEELDQEKTARARAEWEKEAAARGIQP
jgi:8-oxo-dGTP pyrophosphatase MutT (NUDIX family)/predicted double-glycine peptidase